MDRRNRVYEDEEEWFREIFSGSRKEDAIQNQYEFLVQRMGGPPLFSQRRGNLIELALFSQLVHCSPKASLFPLPSCH